MKSYANCSLRILRYHCMRNQPKGGSSQWEEPSGKRAQGEMGNSCLGLQLAGQKLPPAENSTQQQILGQNIAKGSQEFQLRAINVCYFYAKNNACIQEWGERSGRSQTLKILFDIRSFQRTSQLYFLIFKALKTQLQKI